MLIKIKQVFGVFKMTYFEKLKDPRWQRKRLEILQRDNWQCQICKDKDSKILIKLCKIYAKHLGDGKESKGGIDATTENDR